MRLLGTSVTILLDHNNPSTYLGNNYISNSKEDDGGVHRNSTVISHAAYLMTIGVDEDESIESLSTIEMAELFYQTLFQIPQDCNFQQFYSVLLNTANIMLRQNKLSQEQVNCVSFAFSSVNIKPAAPSIYSLHEEAAIYVYDVNGELYNNYTITAASFNKLQNNKTSKFEITVSEPFILDLPPDIYKVTVKDETRKNTIYTLTIVITESGKDILELYTDYGEYKGNNDYSEEASKENANSSAVEWDGEIPLPDKDYVFSGGIGTVEDPFLIMNAADLAMLAVNVNSGESYKSKHFLLGVNIDLMNYEWEPIGCIDGGIAKAFEGKFNGQNNSVNGLFINSVDKYQGLIGYANNSEVKNLMITVNIVGGEMCGGIIGKANSSLIENCRVFGNIFGQNEKVGGIVGESVISTITNCTNEANVGATGKYVGGITGNSNASIIERCHNVASVNGSSYYVGGVVGSITNGTTLSEVISCSNSGEITGGMESVGGIVGNIVAGDKIVGCYNTGKIFGQSKFTGGIAGKILDGSVENSFNKGEVHSLSQTTGGIAGWSHGTISNCFNTGSVSGDSSYVGGITGTTSGSITNCYNTGSIMSTKDVVGGIIGYSFDGAIVSNCYSTGTVSGERIVGGIAGNNHRSSLTNCISLGVTVSGGSAERIASGDFGTFDNNYSRCDQLIIIEGKEIIRQSDKSNTSRGADILVDNSRDIPSFFTATMKWDNEIWDFPLNNFSIGCNLPTLKLAGVEQKPTLPGVTEQNDSGDKSTQKIYKDFLQYIHDHPLEYVELMQGIDGVINIEDIEDCVYAIFDLNDDGVEELVVNFTNTYMAAQYCGVWTIGEDKDIKQMGTFGSSCVFYTNGIVKVEESHNHSNVGETVWPYTLYMLSSDRDSYINFAFGYSADKEYDVTGEAYSVEKDIDGDGIIYYFGLDGNEEPLSLEEYNTLINLHIPDEKLISLNWNKLTNER